MVQVKIIESLEKEIRKKFRKESITIFKHLKSLEKNPTKGKRLGIFSGTLVKELKYKNFRFYFLIEGKEIKFISQEELKDFLIKFVRMSNKKHQQKTINEIKQILIKLGPHGFEKNG